MQENFHYTNLHVSTIFFYQYVILHPYKLSFIHKLQTCFTVFFSIFSQTTLKNQSPIRIPLTGLELSPYTLSGKLRAPDEPVDSVLYDLTGLCVHTGAHTTTHGHYIAYSRGPSSLWYSFNDDYVYPVNNMNYELSQPFVLQNAYLLFYRDTTTFKNLDKISIPEDLK